MRLIHTKPDQSTAAPLVLKMSQAFFRERTQEELPFQDRVSGVVIAFKEIRLMNWMRKAYSSAVIFSGMDQDKPWMMSATRSESEKCK